MNKLFLLTLVSSFCVCACQQDKTPSKLVMTPYFKKAESFLYRQNDSAFFYFNKVVSGSKDSLLIANAYNEMGVIQSDAGDYFGSEESLLLSLKFLDEHKESDRICLSSDYNELGLTNMNLRNYGSAVSYHERAISLQPNEDYKLIFWNNKALALQKQGDYKAALRIYGEIIGRIKKQPKEYARVLSNMARTAWLQDPSYPASAELHRALAIRMAEHDFWGQNASYIHLSDYYARSKPDSALFYAQEEYRIALLINSPDDRLEALQRLIRLAPAGQTKSWFARYDRLNDSIQVARNSAKNQFALIRYDAEKNKADNLKLQKENTDKKYQLERQSALLGLAVLLLLGAVFWYQKRKQRIILETRNTIRENELRISKKVHDVVANGLYLVMQEVQYQDVEREDLVGKIDQLYQRSRDISYDIPAPADDFHTRIAGSLQSFATERRKVLLVGYERGTWSGVSNGVRTELEAVLQELMVNMSKHSCAENVLLRFSRDANIIRIVYTDDGMGILAETPQGNGLKNTGNRMRSVGGNIIFEPNGAKGLRVNLSFPIA